MKYIVAVSGGVDSVVLLDMLVAANQHELIVAHFDHGIRQASQSDAAFVAGLAEKYALPYESTRVKLGVGASESLARNRRYQFLRSVANKHHAQIVTAHHQDDVIETIAINLTRGTGWRGLAVLGDETIHRPLLEFSKRELYSYAIEHKLEWVEDETNASDTYLRNRLRRKLWELPDEAKQTIIELWNKQRQIATAITTETAQLTSASRYFLTMIDDTVASELLRARLYDDDLSLTRPQRLRLLHAIKTAKPGTSYEAGSGTIVTFTEREFIVKNPL